MIPTNDYPSHIQKLLENHRRRIDGRLADFSGERIGTLGIVGAGLMGQAIARAALAQGIEVVLNDVDSARVETVRRELAQRFESSLVRVTADPAVLGEADLVLESVIESIDIKRKVYRWLEPHLGPERFWRPTRQPFRSAVWPRSWTVPSDFAACTFFIRLPDALWSR